MTIPMKTINPTAEHLAFRKALETAIAQHGQILDVFEILALISHLVGQLIAMQDQRIMTSAMALELVMINIERGKREMIEPLLTQTGGSA